MAITADVDLGNGVTASSAYIIIPTANVKKYDDVDEAGTAGFRLLYDVRIYQNADGRNSGDESKRIKCRAVDHHKCVYNPASGEQNAFKLAYADLIANNGASSSIENV